MESLPFPLMLVPQRLPLDRIVVVVLVTPDRTRRRVDGFRTGGRHRRSGGTGSTGFRGRGEEEVRGGGLGLGLGLRVGLSVGVGLRGGGIVGMLVDGFLRG